MVSLFCGLKVQFIFIFFRGRNRFYFYRVNHIAEALDFGYEEYFFSGDRCFIEWPEKIDELLPEGIVDCYFTENPDGSRELKVEI